MIHHQDLSGVIAANSHFRYDDSVSQQKARNNNAHLGVQPASAYPHHQNFVDPAAAHMLGKASLDPRHGGTVAAGPQYQSYAAGAPGIGGIKQGGHVGHFMNYEGDALNFEHSMRHSDFHPNR